MRDNGACAVAHTILVRGRLIGEQKCIRGHLQVLVSACAVTVVKSGRRALALRSLKEEAVLARVVRSPPTILTVFVIWSFSCKIMKTGNV